MRKIISIYGQALRQFLHHEGLVSAGHLAFLSMLGLFPFLIFLISLAAFAGQTRAGVDTIHFILSQLPNDVQNVLHKPVNNLMHDTSRRILLTSILGAVWVSSSTVNAARAAIRRAYDLGHVMSFWRGRIEAIAVVIFSGFALGAGMMILVLGPAALKAVNTIIPISRGWMIFSDYASIVAGMLFMIPALYGAYFTLGPAGHRRKTPLLPGVMTTMFLWLGMGGAFSNYLKYFGQYSNTYGSLAGPIITLLFFYAINVAFLFGAEVNSTIHKRALEKQKADTAEKNE